MKNPTATVKSDGMQKGNIALDVEEHDHLQASTIAFKFICFKTPWNDVEKVPKKLFFNFKFFTFPAVKTSQVIIKNVHEHARNQSDVQGLKPGQPYYLTRVNQAAGAFNKKVDPTQEDESTLSDPNLLAVTFNIDPSLSKIKDEHTRLAGYLYDRFLTVDIFDGDSLFLYGTCKIPLFELLRQGRGSVVRAKECEMCDPETGDFRGAV